MAFQDIASQIEWERAQIAGSRRTVSGMEDPGTNPDIEIYKAVRAHEVMLNQAVSAFEHATYTRLAALNGGAAAAFITLLGTLLKPDGKQTVQPVNRTLAAIAVGLWLLGLLAASIATLCGFERQRTLNVGYRLKREEIEHVIDRNSATGGPSQRVSDIIKYGTPKKDKALLWFRAALLLSAGLFVAGAIPALLAVLLVGA